MYLKNKLILALMFLLFIITSFADPCKYTLDRKDYKGCTFEDGEVIYGDLSDIDLSGSTLRNGSIVPTGANANTNLAGMHIINTMIHGTLLEGNAENFVATGGAILTGWQNARLGGIRLEGNESSPIVVGLPDAPLLLHGDIGAEQNIQIIGGVDATVNANIAVVTRDANESATDMLQHLIVNANINVINILRAIQYQDINIQNHTPHYANAIVDIHESATFINELRTNNVIVDVPDKAELTNTEIIGEGGIDLYNPTVNKTVAVVRARFVDPQRATVFSPVMVRNIQRRIRALHVNGVAVPDNVGVDVTSDVDLDFNEADFGYAIVHNPRPAIVPRLNLQTAQVIQIGLANFSQFAKMGASCSGWKSLNSVRTMATNQLTQGNDYRGNVIFTKGYLGEELTIKNHYCKISSVRSTYGVVNVQNY